MSGFDKAQPDKWFYLNSEVLNSAQGEKESGSGLNVFNMINKKRRREPGKIEIHMEDVEIIMGDDFKHLHKVLNSI